MLFLLSRGFRRLVFRLLAVVMSLAVAYLLINFVLVLKTSSSEDLTHSDALVVMGAAEFNGVPSKVLAARVSTADMLYRRGVAPLVVVVGGSKSGDRFTEAGVSRAVLVRDGLPPSAVVAVSAGDDTYDSLAASLPSLTAHHVRSVTVVSDGFHLYRSEAILKGFGYATFGYADVGSPIHGTLKVKYLLRETVAVSVARVIGYREESILRHG